MELQDHVKRVTAPYKYPRIVEFVDELPKTISGKIRRVEYEKRIPNRYPLSFYIMQTSPPLPSFICAAVFLYLNLSILWHAHEFIR